MFGSAWAISDAELPSRPSQLITTDDTRCRPAKLYTHTHPHDDAEQIVLIETPDLEPNGKEMDRCAEWGKHLSHAGRLDSIMAMMNELGFSF